MLFSQYTGTNANNQIINRLKTKVIKRDNIGLELINLLDDPNATDIIAAIHRQSEEQLYKALFSISGIYLSEPENVFISLVLIAMMYYDGSFYEHVSSIYASLYEKFTPQKIEGLIRTILSRYRTKDEIKCNSRIINTVLMNAIVPSAFLPSFFDFIYDIYKLNLEYSISDDKDELYDDFKFIYDGLRSNMILDDDNIQINVTKKSYKLIRSTKKLIINSTGIDEVIELSIKVAKIIDKKIWGKEFIVDNPYLKYGYEKWALHIKEKNGKSNSYKSSDFRSRWIPKYSLSNNIVSIIPPIHRIKGNYDYRDIYIIVKNDEDIVFTDYNPDIREIIGGYQITPNKISLDSPIGKITYKLMSGSKEIYDSEDRLYRDCIVFDEKGNEIQNNTDYSGAAIFCIKSPSDKIKVFYKNNNFCLGSKTVKIGEIVCLEDIIFNFSHLIHPGIIGKLYENHFIMEEGNERKIPVYKQANILEYECEDKYLRFDFVVNGQCKSPEEFRQTITKNAQNIRLSIDIENMPSGVYASEIYGWANGKRYKLFDYDFAIDEMLEADIAEVDSQSYLVYINSSLIRDSVIKEFVISEFNDKWLSFEFNGKNYNYLIPLDLDIYRIDEGQWKSFNDDIWIGDIRHDSVIEIYNFKYDSISLLTSTGKHIEEIPKFETASTYRCIKIGFLISYKSNFDYISILFLVNTIVKGALWCYNKCLIDTEKTSIIYNISRKTLDVTPNFRGRGNVFFKITTDDNKEIYRSSFIENNVTCHIKNLMSFVDYTITFYEKEKGLAIKKEKILATYKQTIYAREDFVGRAFKIKDVYFDQCIRGKFVRQKYSFNTTYLKFVKMINNDNFIGEVYVKTSIGIYMLNKINPVEIEVCSDVIDGIIELSVTKDGDGLLMDFEHHGIKNTMYDSNAVDIFSYSIRMNKEENHE